MVALHNSKGQSEAGRVAKRNETKAVRALTKNGKYFVPPVEERGDIKALLRRLAAAGAGRPADRNGFPEGPWTPELIADAISALDANRSGIDLRTVQLWFQDNGKGISSENIRWLARIFGCDDPKATSKWQAELTAANRRLKASRRERRSADIRPARPTSDMDQSAKKNPLTEVGQRRPTKQPNNHFSLAKSTEALLSGRSALTLPTMIWAGSAILALLAYFIGTHSITYTPEADLEKQVGLLVGSKLDGRQNYICSPVPLLGIRSSVFLENRWA